MGAPTADEVVAMVTFTADETVAEGTSAVMEGLRGDAVRRAIASWGKQKRARRRASH